MSPNVPFLIELLVYPVHSRHNHVRLCDVRAELVGRKGKDLVIREKCGKLPPGLGETLAAEENLHMYFR